MIDHTTPATPAIAPDVWAVTIADLRRVAGIPPTTAYRLLAAGELRAVKSGSRTLVLAESVRDYLARLPAAQSTTKPRTRKAA